MKNEAATLFDLNTVHSKRRDPPSSHEAGERVYREGIAATQCQLTLSAVRRFPGKTAKKIAEFSCLDRYMVQRRLRGLARQGEVRNCKHNPRDCPVCTQGDRDYSCPHVAAGELRWWIHESERKDL